MQDSTSHGRSVSGWVVVIKAPVFFECEKIGRRQRRLDERVTTVHASIEYANGRRVHSWPDNPFRQIIRPLVFVAVHIICKKYRRIIGTSQLGNCSRGE